MEEFKNVRYPIFVIIFLFCTSLRAQNWIYPDDIDRLIEQAKLMTDTNYSFGARKINSTDCSHFIQTSFDSIGISLPRASFDQGSDDRFELIPVDFRRKGDLLFFKNTYKKGVSHVALVIGKNRIIHASTKKKKVVISKLTPTSKLMKKFAFAKRYKYLYPKKFYKAAFYTDFTSSQNNQLKLTKVMTNH
jgi:peptidoglycan endopeptidase LytE